MKVFVVGPSVGYARAIHDCEFVHDIKDAEIVLFTGGEDISPALYGCTKHPSTYFTKRRDDFEVEMWKQIRPDQVAFGICRGAQFFCAMFGGKLVQDVTDHCGCSHEITNGEDTYSIPSIHHQMMYPFEMPKEDYDILYRSSQNLSQHYLGDGINKDVIDCEPEIVVFHKEGMPVSLGVQGHPEIYPSSPVTNKINVILKNLVENAKRNNRS